MSAMFVTTFINDSRLKLIVSQQPRGSAQTRASTSCVQITRLDSELVQTWRNSSKSWKLNKIRIEAHEIETKLLTVSLNLLELTSTCRADGRLALLEYGNRW